MSVHVFTNLSRIALAAKALGQRVEVVCPLNNTPDMIPCTINPDGSNLSLTPVCPLLACTFGPTQTDDRQFVQMMERFPDRYLVTINGLSYQPYWLRPAYTPRAARTRGA